MIQAVRNAFVLPDLRRKILFTFLILAVYRLACHVPVPGVNADALKGVFESNQLLGLLDLLSGGAMSEFSVMAMGVYPYITASIILQLLTPIIPALERLQKEGEQGRNKLNQWTWYLTVPLALLQAYTQAQLIQRAGGADNQILSSFGFSTAPLTTTAILISMTAGTLFAVWLGELISEQGIGNGTSIIILGGIVARLPEQLLGLIASQLWIDILIFIAITVITVFGIVIIQEGKLQIWVQYASRTLGQRGGRLRQTRSVRTHIPLRVNMAGMIPLIFAQSLLVFPSTIASYFLPAAGAPVGIGQNIAWWVDRMFNPQYTVYWPLYFLLVVGFTFFYTNVIFQQQNLAENLRKQGASIPGIRPGKRTEDYLMSKVRRITLVGAIFLGVVAILPWLVGLFAQLIPSATAGVSGRQIMLITSTGLLIVVGVILDTMRQLEAQLQMRHYDKFLRRGILG